MSERRPFEWVVNPETGCWECISHKPNSEGYPVFTMHHKKRYVHRYLYEELFGPLEPGLVVRHKCDNRLCINPKHLTHGTYQDNSNDMKKRKRHRHRHYVGEGFKKQVVQTAKTESPWKAVNKYGINIKKVEQYMREFGYEPPKALKGKKYYRREFAIEVVRCYDKRGYKETMELFDVDKRKIENWCEYYKEYRTKRGKKNGRLLRRPNNR